MADGSTPQGWRAELNLRFAPRGGQTRLVQRSHTGPLLVQRPFHPEGDVCHAYIVHPPGGVVGGDTLQLKAHLDAGSHALLTTPAATKFYRSDGRIAHQTQQLAVTDATAEWLPQESIFHRGAAVRNSTCLHLNTASRVIGWEIACLGLPARDERFEEGELRLGLELWVDGTPRFIDRLRIEGRGDARTAAWGFAGHEALGTLLAYPGDRGDLDSARAACEEHEASVTLVDGVLVCRCLASQAEPIKRIFVEMWRQLRPRLLGRPATAPRIWAT